MRHKTIALVALVTLAAVVPLTMADHATYSDEFADGTQDWRTKGSADWQVVNGQRGGILWGANDEDLANATHSLAYAGLGWADYRYTVELMRIGNISANPAVGVAWRNHIDKGYYSLYVRDGGYAFGVPNLAGGSALGGFVSVSWIDVDHWNQVIIETRGTQHKFILNGELVGTLNDATAATGNIGVTLAPGAQAVYDNAFVTTMLDPPVDDVDPIVGIVSPTPDLPTGRLLVTGNSVTVTVFASDDTNGNGTQDPDESGLAIVRAYLDGKIAATLAGSPSATSYVLTVDVSRASLGNHRITVMAEDKAHNRAFAGLDLFVVNHCASIGPGTPTCLP